MRFFKSFNWIIPLLLCSSSYANEAVCDPQRLIDVSQLKARVIIVGETHGTNEIPLFVSGLACSLVTENRPLMLGLEIPVDEQIPILEYLKSSGMPNDKMKLTSGKFWHSSKPDGRSSEAMLRLIESVRLLHASQKDILLFAIDAGDKDEPILLTENETFWPGWRDSVMALNIETRLQQYPTYTALILVGNYHSEMASRRFEETDIHPMAERLSRYFTTQHIDFSTTGGDAWACDGASADKAICSPHPRRARPSLSKTKYDVIVPLGTISASYPASVSSQ